MTGIREELRQVYKGIECYCKECDQCCFTYGWILPSEEQNYLCDLIQINNKVLCFNSFEKDSKGKPILGKIPRCVFYKNKSCSINNSKPFDCLLYPVKVLFIKQEKKFLIVLSKDCPYIKNLSKESVALLKKEIKQIFLERKNSEILEYLEMVKRWDVITIKKDFEYIPIVEIKDLRAVIVWRRLLERNLSSQRDSFLLNSF